METSEQLPPEDDRPPVARLVMGRAVAAAPAMLGSLLIVIALSGALGRWAELLLLAWAACAAAALTPVGERMAVRIGCGFRRPTPAQAAALQPAWEAALRLTGTAAGKVELYVATDRLLNAYAAGRRSVAVTGRVVEDYCAGRLPRDQLVAVLVHELGHAVTGSARPMLFLAWLVAPWRLATGLWTGVAGNLAGGQPRRGLMVVVVAGWAVTVARAVQLGQWTAGGVLALLGLTVAFGPFLDAAISRRSEYAADRYTADHGLAVPLAAALRALDPTRLAAPRWRRLKASHPTPEERIRRLGKTTAHPDDVCRGVCQRRPSSPVPAGPRSSAHHG